MRYINCLNNISAKGTDLLGSDYQLTDDIAQASGVLVRSAAMHDMDLPESLLAVARAGAGVNNIPLDKCAEAGVVVFNTPGANANAVKELVLCGMLLASRGILPGAAWCREHADSPTIGKDAEKAKKAFAGQEIFGKTLGVIGLGAIGALVANAAIDLGMNVLGYDPYVSAEAEDNCAIMATLQMKDYLENGNIKNSVNYPACDMGPAPAQGGRVAVLHANVPDMLSQITGVFGEVGANIDNLTNKARGNAAYTMLDLNAPATDELVAKLTAIEGVHRVRIVK